MNAVKTHKASKDVAETTARFTGPKETEDLIYLKPEELKDIVPNPANRVDKEHHHRIQNLRKLMREYGFSQQFPIIIGSNLMIKAGHHRYFAALEEGIGVWVKINDNYSLRDMARMEGAGHPAWSTSDWISYYANAGKEEYKNILAFCKQYVFGIKVALMLLTDTAAEASSEQFALLSSGELKVKDWPKTIWKAQSIKAFCPFFISPKDYKNTHFCAAILKCLKTKGYNNDKMIEKVKANPTMLRLQRNRLDTLEMLQTIYNYGLKSTDDSYLKLT